MIRFRSVRIRMAALLGMLPAFAAASAMAAEKPVYELVIENHTFTPSALTVPVETPFALKIQNKDSTAEEFESNDFKREKIIPGGATATVNVGGLKPGTYHFFGEFHEKTAQGTVTAQ